MAPGRISLIPLAFEMNRQPGGRMLDTCTRLHFSIPASLRASSKECSSSRCLPTPLVKNILRGTWVINRTPLPRSVVADIASGLQDAGEIIGHHLCRGLLRGAGDHMDPLAEEQFLGPRTHAAGDDHIGPLFLKPGGQKARLMGRRNEHW